MEAPVTWLSLPHKDQLIVLVFARFCEPLVRTSIVSYIYYQLKSFDPALTPKEIVEQAALLQTVFTICQCFTALIWGRVADSPKGGRKMVLTIGLLGSMLSCVAFGFVSNFAQAVVVRAIEGLVNGNVAVIRTMVSEVVQDPRYKQRAFLLMPMAFNVAVVIGPVMASMVVGSSYSEVKPSPKAPLLSQYPFAKPALLNGAVLMVALALVVLRLKETLKPLRNKHDYGLHIAQQISRMLFPTKNEVKYSQVSYQNLEEEESEVLLEPLGPQNPTKPRRQPAILPLRRMFTPNLCLTIVCQGILEGHLGAYNTLWPSFLSLPAVIRHSSSAQNPFQFLGGLGMPVKQVAASMALLGLVGIPVQVFGYPRLSQKFGTTKLWRFFLFGFPLCYFITPFTVILKSKIPSTHGASVTVWLIIGVVQTLSVISGTFVLPAQIMLTNNASPHPTALGRTHSAAVLLSSFSRSISPVIGGIVLGYSSERGMTELAWWIMCIVALVGCGLSFLVREGNGHEIWLPGDDEEQSE